MKYELIVRDQGRQYTLEYRGLLAFCGGNALAGATIGFRVMQAAAFELGAQDKGLEREYIHVTSGHPGPGYRDAFEYGLRCVSRDRFKLDQSLREGRHSPFHAYAFQFIVIQSDLEKEVTITLRENILPVRFFEVLRELKEQQNNPDLSQELDNLKQSIAQTALVTSLDRLFDTRVASLE